MKNMHTHAHSSIKSTYFEHNKNSKVSSLYAGWCASLLRTKLAILHVHRSSLWRVMPVFLIVIPYDGVMAAIFKDGRQKGIKLPILNVRFGVLDTSEISLTKNPHWICSPFLYSRSV